MAQEDKKPLSKLENLKTPEVNKISPTKSKSMPDISTTDISSRLENEGRSVNTFDNSFKLEKEGKNPNPFREETLLTKGIREGYIPCQCGNCGADFSHIDSQKTLPPLILDFLDKNPMNTKLENLRALCFNCVYELAPTKKGWYRHRETPIGQALDEATPGKVVREIPKDDKLSYIPFEEFQKSLNN